LIGTSLATAAAATVGTLASRSGVKTWYPVLNKPRYTPPKAAFPVAWTTIYAIIAGTSAATIDRLHDRGDDQQARRYAAALGANLAVNASWSWLFFRRHQLGASAVLSGVLLASSLDLTRRTAQVNPRAGLALLPYPAWTTLATALSTDIWRLSR